MTNSFFYISYARSLRAFGRAIVLTEAPAFAGPAAEITCQILDAAFDYLNAPIIRLSMPDTIIPFAPPLEQRIIPSIEDVMRAVKNVL